MITFVTHFVEIQDKQFEEINKVILRFFQGKPFHHSQPQKLIELMIQSAKKTHPDARFVILTDEKTQFNLSEDISIIRSAQKGDQIDFERMGARIDYLKNHPLTENIIFLDWDILIQKNLEHIFHNHCDMFFTLRTARLFPVNDGIIGVKIKNIKHVIHFFESMQKYYNNLKPEFKKWWGFQLLIKHFFDFRKIKNGILHTNNLTFGFLPVLKYNASPKIDQLSVYQKEPFVIHFKGERKKMMENYWENFLN